MSNRRPKPPFPYLSSDTDRRHSSRHRASSLSDIARSSALDTPIKVSRAIGLTVERLLQRFDPLEEFFALYHPGLGTQCLHQCSGLMRCDPPAADRLENPLALLRERATGIPARRAHPSL